MTAAVISAPCALHVDDQPLPEPATNQVLIALEGCGVCASNLPVWEGRDWFNYPMPPGNPGHEGWGHVVACGAAVADLKIGERVAFLSERAYATHDVADRDALVKLPPALDGQPFPAEPLACAINVFRRSGIQPGDQVAIIGIGFLGAILTRLATDAGAQVIAISRRPFALEMAKTFGAVQTIPMHDHWAIIEEVKHLTDDQGCKVVIEAVGKQWPLDLAGELTQTRGRLVIAGYHQDGPRQVNMQQWNWRGLDVINAHEREQAVYLAGMQAAVEAVASGGLDPTPLYTHRFALDELPEAFTLMSDRPDGFFKALVML